MPRTLRSRLNDFLAHPYLVESGPIVHVVVSSAFSAGATAVITSLIEIGSSAPSDQIATAMLKKLQEEALSLGEESKEIALALARAK